MPPLQAADLYWFYCPVVDRAGPTPRPVSCPERPNEAQNAEKLKYICVLISSLHMSLCWFQETIKGFVVENQTPGCFQICFPSPAQTQ